MFGRLRVLGVPSFRTAVDPEHGKSFTTYQVQIVYNGTIKTLERRYREFLDLHKRLQKTVTLRADFPPKTVLGQTEKFLEKRRQGLENYLQAVIHEGSEDLPLEVYSFFEIDPSTQTNSDNDGDSVDGEDIPQCPTSQHQPVITFDSNLFLEPSSIEINEKNHLCDIVLQGSLEGFYED